MKPNPLSRTSRLIVPLGIRVSLGARAQGARLSIFVPPQHAVFGRVSTPSHLTHQVFDANHVVGVQTLSNHFTFIVISWQVPGSVLWRSSPICRASLCLPGVSCMSISDLPSPKWTQAGVPLRIPILGEGQLVSTPG